MFVFIFWTFIGLFAVIQSYIHYSIHNQEIDGILTWGRLFLEIIPGWYYWGLITPLVFKLSRRFPFERHQNLLSSSFIHLLLSCVLAIFYLLTNAFFYNVSRHISLYPDSVLNTLLNRMISGFYFAVLTYWAILGVGFAINYYRRFREREVVASRLELHSSKLETQLVKTQLEALKMQLHPHFLFNTLHSISALMEDDVKSARRMIARLSELLRFTLDNSQKETVSLREEIDLLNLYLDIERERFKEKLDVKIEIPNDVWEYRVPNFILQPLVENAVKHGLSKNDAKSLISVSAFQNNGHLQITVADNGAGVDEKLQEGIGLRNTRERLERLYGNNYEFNLKNAPNSGVIISMTIPAIKRSDEN